MSSGPSEVVVRPDPYPPVGRCIYCGESDPAVSGRTRFADEHIIPFAFGGELVLPEAVCRRCEAIINKQIESPILRTEWGPLRDRLGWPTRDKAGRRARATTQITMRDGSRQTVKRGDHSTPTIMYRFTKPNILSGFTPSSPDANWTITMLADTEKEKTLRMSRPNWDGRHQFKTRPYEFARFVAKIAHGFAVAEYGLEAFEPKLTGLILGADHDYFHRVGGSLDLQEPDPQGGNHHLELWLEFFTPKKAHLIVGVRLLRMISSPQYYAVAGEVDLDRPAHRDAFERHRLAGKIEIPSPSLSAGPFGLGS